MSTDATSGLAARRRVVAIELPGRGHSRDVGRPFFALLRTGLRDPGWDRSAQATESRLSLLPGLTRYDSFTAPQPAEVVDAFLA
jgi:hypothetical protein